MTTQQTASTDSTASPSTSNAGNPATPDFFQSGRVVTILTDIQNRPQGKRFSLSPDGQINKEVSQHAGEYWARSVHVPNLPALAALITGFSPADVLILGCIPAAGFDPYRITPQSQLIRLLGIPRDMRPIGLHTIGGATYAARLKENFIPCRYLLIDRDPAGAPAGVAGLDDDGYIRLIDTAWPGMAGCERITFDSSSGRIAFADGRPALTAGASSHTYIEMAGDDWRDWDDLRIRQEAAGWNAGLGFNVTAKGGATLKRLPWDTSVFSSCREVFESAPAVGPGLFLLPRSYQHTPGGQCPPPPALTVESIAATRRETGAKINGSRAVAVDMTGALRADTRIETQRYGVLTVAEYMARNGDRTRCQTPFRASSSWNGILGRTKQGGVYLHDNGIRQTYFLADDAMDSAEYDDGPESTTAIELHEDSHFSGDLTRLSQCPPAQCRATARKILTRYAAQSPRKRTFTELATAVITALPKGHNPGLPRSLMSFADWLERQARQRAIQSSSIKPLELQHAGIEYRRVDDLTGLAALIAANPLPLYLVRAPHGTGKTELVLKPLARLPGCAVAITNRVSLVADLCHRLNLENYQTIRPGDIEAVDALGICLPSIANPKFGDVLSRASGVLVDEIAAVLREIHTPGGTLKKTGPDVMRRLAAMLNHARVAVGVDADLSTLDTLTLAGLITRPIVVLDMAQQPHDCRVSFADADKMKAAILEAVANGEKCRVACDSSRTAIELAALLREQNPDKTIVAIQSRQGDSTAGDPDVLALLKDVNAGLVGVDCLIHSPTVESGVSITIPHFTRTFGLFGGRSVAPAGFIQMLRRDRTATHFEIGFAGNCRQWLPTHQRAILDSLEATHRRTVELCGDSGAAAGLIRIEPATGFDKTICAYQAARNVDVNDAAQHLLLLLESRRFKVAPALLFQGGITKEDRQEARRLADADYSERVLSAPVIDATQRAALDSRYQLNPDETAQVERYDAAIANGVLPEALTADDLRLFEHGALPRWNRRFDLLNAAPLAGLADDVTDADFHPALILRRHELATGEAYRTFFEVAGLDLRTGAGEVNAETALEAWRNLLASPVRPVLEHSGLCHFDREPRDPVRWLSDALKKFGLALESHGRDRAYSLCRDVVTTKDGLTVKAAGLDAMHRCSQQRVENKKILESVLRHDAINSAKAHQQTKAPQAKVAI